MDTEKWFVVDPRDGRLWMVPIVDLDKVLTETGFIAPWHDGWIPMYQNGVYTGCETKNGDCCLNALQRIAYGKSKCRRGPTWSWSDQDGGGSGIVEKSSLDGWITVAWSLGGRNGYRFGVTKDETEHRVYYDVIIENDDVKVPVNEAMMKKYERLRII
jgi:hypothetical protein